MYLGKRIAVVVPCKNEETQIESVLTRIPQCADAIIVIDDGSTDATSEVALACGGNDPRIELIRHDESRGVGGAIAAGYARARDEGYDVTVVMAGDDQMDPDDFELVVYPVAFGVADYCKGNRFKYAGGLAKIPPTRMFGNFVLSILTKLVSGYWHISDSQTGYTAISLAALRRIDVESIYPSYGCPNDILIRLNIADMRVAEVPINPVYNVGEQSKMRILKVIRPILWLLGRGFVSRLFRKHVLANAHPLVLAYALAGLFLGGSGLLLGLCVFRWLTLVEFPVATLVSSGVSLISGLQFLLAGFWMDFQANEHLAVNVSPEMIDELSPLHKSDGAVVSVNATYDDVPLRKAS